MKEVRQSLIEALSDTTRLKSRDINEILAHIAYVKHLMVIFQKGVLSCRDLPHEQMERINKLLGSGPGFEFVHEIKTTIEPHEPVRMGRNYMIQDPDIYFKATLISSPENLVNMAEAHVQHLISWTAIPYLRDGRTMKQLIASVSERIVFASDSEEINEMSESLCRMLERNFNLTVVRKARPGIDLGSDLYFNFENAPAGTLTEPFITSPAILAIGPGRTEVLKKGTMLIPQLNNTL